MSRVTEPGELRRRARQRLGDKPTQEVLPSTDEDLRRLVHELQVRQAELEIQNEELRQVQAALEESGTRFREFFDFAPVGYFSFDSQGVILGTNLRGADLLGVERSRLAGRRFEDFISTQARSAFSDWIARVFAERTVQACEIPLVLGPKESRNVRIEAVVSRSDTECRAVVVDISERMHSEEELRQREERMDSGAATLQGILDAAQESIWLFDPDGTILLGNDTALSRLCKCAGEVVGRRFEEFVPESLWTGRREALQRVVESGLSVDWEDERAGIRFHHTYCPVKDATGSVIRVAAFSRDITERTRVDEALRLRSKEAEAARVEAEEGKRLLEAVMEALPVGVAITDAKGGNIRANRAFEAIWAGPRPPASSVDDYVRYKAWWPGTGQPVLPDEWASARAVREAATVAGQFLEIERFDGSRAFVLNSASPIKGADGEIVGSAVAIHDVTDLRRAEAAVRESEDRLSFALATSHTGAWDLDLLSQSAYRSPEHDRIFGYSELLPEWTYQMFLEHVLPEDRADVDASFQHAVKTHGDWSFECRIRRVDGEVRWIWAAGRHRQGAEGTLLRMAGIVQDITERKNAYEALRRSEERYRMLAETMTQGVVHQDAEGTIIAMNPAAERILGKSPAEFLEQTSVSVEHDTIHEDGTPFPGLEHPAMVALRTGEPQPDSVMGVFNPRQGEYRWIRVAAVPLRRSASDKPHEVYTIFDDITERKRVEEALKRSEALYRGIGESIDYGVWVCSPTGENIYASQSFLDMVGITQEQCSKFGWGEVLHPDDADRTIAAWKECVRTGGKWDIEHRFRGADGQWRHVLARGVPIRDEHGEITSWAGINLDITHLKLVEEELREAKVAADAAARAKAEFLANMSHEIRTPMNAVIGFTDILLRTPLNPDQRRFLFLIKNSGDALLDIVNDVLDLSKMEAGKFDFVEEDFDLRDLVEKVARTLGLRAHQKGLELTGHVPFSLPTAVVGDPARLRQVLVNLLGNAIKFTDQGEVHIGVQQVEPSEGGSGDRVWFRFSVRDTGVGIPQEKLGQIFQSFQQVDGSSTRRHEGTGLGLFISRRIVEQLGGSIEVESVVGEGSTFSFTVPFRLRPEPLRASYHPPEIEELRGRRVLVVDDNATNRMIILEMLTTQGMSVSLASAGEEALGLLRAAKAAGQPYELLLVDCQMPGMDGFQLIERVKGNSRFPEPAIVMITSDDMPGYTVLARAAGADGYLVKPVVCAELLSAIRTVLLGARPQEDVSTQDAPRTASTGRTLRFLLAEDNTVNQILVRSLVEREGWSVDVVADGRAALEALSGDANYDLVLMDVQMPVMDGYEATRALRELENYKKSRRRMPVIGLTARALPGDRQLCLDAGMDDYLAKPLEPQALLDAVRRLVAADQTREPPAELPAGLVKNPAILAMVTEQFLKEYAGNLEELRDSVDKRSAEAITALSHRLRGSIVVFGARDAALAASRLEDCGREGHLDDVEPAFEHLEREVHRLAAYLEDIRALKS